MPFNECVLLFLFSFVLCRAAILPIGKTINGAAYTIPITVGGQSVLIDFDTGSPESWITTNATTCFRVGREIPCSLEFGPPYIPGPTYTLASGSNRGDIRYGDRSFVTGRYGYDDFSFGDIKVLQSRFITTDYTTVLNLKPASGLLGLGYPIDSLQNNTALASKLNKIPKVFQSRVHSYNVRGAIPPGSPILDTLFAQTNTPPFFGIALSRSPSSTSITASNGIFTLGEHPSSLADPWLNITSSSPQVTIPVQKTTFFSLEPSYEFYTINISSILMGPNSSSVRRFVSSDSQYILDSGTTLNYVPSVYAAYVNSHFIPPAYQDASDGLWYVDCDAQPPRVGWEIGAGDFYMNSLDLFFRIPASAGGGCLSTIQEASPRGTNILGDAFLTNVYMEVYRGAWGGRGPNEVWLGSREFYQV